MHREHVVQQGECLTSIAAAYGFASGAAIYDHPANAAFRTHRPDPNVLLPGDVIAIPVRRDRVEARSTDVRHAFSLSRPRRLLRLMMKADSTTPLANREYELIVGDQMLRGVTAADGLLEQWIPAHATTGALTLPSLGLTWTVAIGHLDPVEHDGQPVITGVQARLRNLGYYSGEIDGAVGDTTRSAIEAFEREVLHREPPSGEPDRDVRRALLQRHGC
jgi:hypothetical protein